MIQSEQVGMRYVIKCGRELSEAPAAFRQFYMSVGRVAEDKLRILNETMSYEPYKARIERDDQHRWYLIFTSEEDWIQFNMRWA